MGVKAVHEHAGYNSHTLDMDFSILELSENLTFSDQVKPACLPETDALSYAGLDGRAYCRKTQIRLYFTLIEENIFDSTTDLQSGAATCS